ncbi:MAG: magnesium transporter [Candidatus Saccharimonadales bacterium]
MINSDKKYPEESAGAICDRNIAVVPLGSSVTQVMQLLRSHADNYDTLDYVYVTDHANRLVGILPLRQLFLQPDSAQVDSFMTKDVTSVSAETDQEHIVNLALSKNLKSIPIVDGDNFIGVVSPHKLLKILHSEHVEDMLKSSGVIAKELSSKFSIFRQLKLRLPWLIYGAVGGLFAAGVINWFESSLQEQVLLAAFIPLVVYLADAVGTQVQTIYIRAYAFGLSKSITSIVLKEIIVAAMMGAILSGLLAATIMLWFGTGLLSMIVAVSVFIGVITAGVVAVILPRLFIRLGRDPAVASGPLGTIILDVGSIIIYFAVAETILKAFS